MGSLGSSVARTVESRGIVSGSTIVNHLTSRVLSGTASGNTLSVLSTGSSSLSPNSLLLANSIQQRATEMLRNVPSVGSRSSSSNTFIGRPYGSSSTGGSSMMGLGSSFGGDSAPPPLDLSEFPSLTSRTSETSQQNTNPMVGRQPYGNCLFGQVGMVKQPTTESSEFTMSSEDFPALPGSQVSSSKIFSSDENFPPLSDKKLNSTNTSETTSDLISRSGDKTTNPKRGIQTTAEGKVTNIPSNMVTDQFGMVGLLMFIRAAETDSNLLSLAQGSDLTTLGLNLNSPENLYPNFGGPWAETPCRPQDIDYHVPQEYLTNQQIRGKLAPIKFERYGEDLLFYMFYSNAGDRLQILAASELYNRDWRYHKDEKVWITRAPGMAPVEKAANYERGTYFYFDAQKWRKVPKDFHLEYDKLEERPHIPSLGGITHTPSSTSL
ncbi:CCR4-NOT transcription complex subunit 2 [Armadillidium nasatum]|uniref:CCR4-NOT transcription complex subunit 2 n=1 Tax=Armadillidium nasatum TaxID=96803 RepID=A0A5N5SPU0_9CRUS|nr:CCR4-NOT transcription complex subunit 2 [Armadillidium nasatum]